MTNTQNREGFSPLAFLKNHAGDLASYAGLLITVVLFLIFSWSRLSYNFGTVLQATSTYAVIALGGVFIYSMGFMDVSLGQQVGVYAIMLVMISNKVGGVVGVIVGFLAVLALALVCGAFNGAVAVFLKLPSIVTSLFLLFFFTGAQLLLMEGTGNSSVSMEMSLKPASRDAYNVLLITVMVIMTLIVTYLFNFTRFGKYTRAIGANEVAAEQSGVNLISWKVLAYMMLGACVAVGSLLMVIRTGSAGKGTGNGYAMDVMICLILGGMPLSGGMRSKVRCALIGTFTYVLLTNDLTTMGIDLNIINFVKAIVFIVIVLFTCRKSDKLLPR